MSNGIGNDAIVRIFASAYKYGASRLPWVFLFAIGDFGDFLATLSRYLPPQEREMDSISLLRGLLILILALLTALSCAAPDVEVLEPVPPEIPGRSDNPLFRRMDKSRFRLKSSEDFVWEKNGMSVLPNATIHS